ncbi:MAG: repair protein [Parcubacteria group bacterium GW2011_GWE2_39_37]|uniref:Non-homologous end joining protein Ku n=1 Tax=Candidatus Falkowbacteria bacterium GW2011_GWF2_39_8 TaxID=1618642 RepID=A0A0G0T3V8_9BACT|nr:MAG: repair protein [Parcubacteria group bacterium GW2011_GWE2_39_37]KKR32522.1 MAG: repair protein [Candidatus Falkowbacteria bacterium GW2011_GWF2_39_8]
MRPIWSGIIGFGLINIPIKIYSASEERKFSFDYLRKKDLCPIKYLKICKTDGQEVPYKDIVRGYEFEKGQYVVIEDEDFKKINLKRSQMIEIVGFIKQEEIDYKLFEKPYYIEPEKNTSKAYAILREALRKSKKAGIAKFVMHTREYLVVIAADKEALILNQLRFPEQLRRTDELFLPRKNEFTAKELEIAIQLINQLTIPFQPEKYKDTYNEQLQIIIDHKLKGKVFRIEKEEMPVPTAIPDIMAKLKESLEYAQKRK